MKIGISAPWEHSDFRTGLAARVAAGFELIVLSDHVSFRDGSGQDGLLRAAMIHALQPSVQVLISSYLLALRHPVVVARQLVELNEIAPGKLILGVGVGGDDRHEIESCGVDPRTRGQRTNEALQCLQALQTGEAIKFTGKHFQLEHVRITPRVEPNTPIIIAGRARQALVRAARYGSGWFGIFLSLERFRAALIDIDDLAVAHGRTGVNWSHGMQFWCCIDDNTDRAKSRLAERMEGFYKVPFEKFERYCPAGTPAQVSQFIAEYVRAGASIVNLTPIGEDNEVIAQASQVQALLEQEFGSD